MQRFCRGSAVVGTEQEVGADVQVQRVCRGGADAQVQRCTGAKVLDAEVQQRY